MTPHISQWLNEVYSSHLNSVKWSVLHCLIQVIYILVWCECHILNMQSISTPKSVTFCAISMQQPSKVYCVWLLVLSRCKTKHFLIFIVSYIVTFTALYISTRVISHFSFSCHFSLAQKILENSKRNFTPPSRAHGGVVRLQVMVWRADDSPTINGTWPCSVDGKKTIIHQTR